MLHIAQCLDNGMIVVTALVPHPVAPYSSIGFSLESDTARWTTPLMYPGKSSQDSPAPAPERSGWQKP